MIYSQVGSDNTLFALVTNQFYISSKREFPNLTFTLKNAMFYDVFEMLVISDPKSSHMMNLKAESKPRIARL